MEVKMMLIRQDSLDLYKIKKEIIKNNRDIIKKEILLITTN